MLHLRSLLPPPLTKDHQYSGCPQGVYLQLTAALKGVVVLCRQADRHANECMLFNERLMGDIRENSWVILPNDWLGKLR